MKTSKILLLLCLLNALPLSAQTDTSRWQTFNHPLYTIRYLSTDWVQYADSLLKVEFVLATKSTIKKPYDRDRILLRVKNNYDGIYGTLKEYANLADASVKSGELVSGKLYEKDKLPFYETVNVNKMGKNKRQIKNRVYFINKNMYELEFETTEKNYPLLITQVDSTFDSFLPKDYAVTVATSWIVMEKPSFSMNYPSNWIVPELVPQHVEFMLRKPQKSSDKGYWDNVYLMVNVFKTTTPDLSSYAQNATNQLKATLKNAVINSSSRKKVNNLSFQEVISEGNLGSHYVKMKQRHFVKGKKAYTLTYSARVESFDETLALIDQMFDSFMLK